MKSVTDERRLFLLAIGLFRRRFETSLAPVCLGIVLNCWLRGPVCGSIRLQSRSVQVLSDRLMRRVNIVHRESVSETDRWNAVEFRQCLLYTVHSHLKKIENP
jgi:hypothetical protein